MRLFSYNNGVLPKIREPIIHYLHYARKLTNAQVVEHEK